MTKPINETLKEGGRLFLFGLVSWLLSEGVINSLVAGLFGSRLSAEQVVTLTGAMFWGIKLLDKFLHENEKEKPVKERNTGLLGIKGLSGF